MTEREPAGRFSLAHIRRILRPMAFRGLILYILERVQLTNIRISMWKESWFLSRSIREKNGGSTTRCIRHTWRVQQLWSPYRAEDTHRSMIRLWMHRISQDLPVRLHFPCHGQIFLWSVSWWRKKMRMGIVFRSFPWNLMRTQRGSKTSIPTISLAKSRELIRIPWFC